MQTLIQKEFDFSLAVQLLKQGEPIAFPTETVYGLGALFSHEEGIRKIFQVKGRPSDNPLIVHLADLDDVHRLAKEIPPVFYLLAHAFWPGPLTFILKRKESVPSALSAGQPTVAVRMPSHPMALALIEEAKEPLAAPSANLSGRPSGTCAEDVFEDFGGKIPLILDGGECIFGIESTVLSLYHSVPTLLRPGQITGEMLEAVLKRTIAQSSKEDAAYSPGMKYRHYAPKAKVRLVEREEDLQGNYVLSERPLACASRKLCAQTFYMELRRADRLGVDLIEIYCDAHLKQDSALLNRILHASGEELTESMI